MIPKVLRTIQTPLILAEWRRQLEGHPDKDCRDYLLKGIEQGFRIGFQHGLHACTQARVNIKATNEQPEIVQEYLASQVRLGTQGE